MVDVPFELWHTGRDEDPADDYRLFCYMLDNNSDGVFNLAWGSADADHGASDGTDDPFTDRMYWLAPTDNTPGTQGYDNLITSITLNPAGRPGWSESIRSGSEAWSIVTRLVIMNWDGGDVTTAASPADYNQAMPETGTTFRIVTQKPNYPGDVLILDAPVSVSDDNNLPNTFYLYQNYPNPFNPTTSIRFNIAKQTDVKIEIFNILGQKVATLIDKKMTAGKHSVVWNGRSKNGIKLGSGIYFYRIKAGNYIKTHKMTLLK